MVRSDQSSSERRSSRQGKRPATDFSPPPPNYLDNGRHKGLQAERPKSPLLRSPADRDVLLDEQEQARTML